MSFRVKKIEPTGIGFTNYEFSEFRHRIARSIGLNGVYAMTDTDMYLTKRYKEIESTHPMHPFIDHDDNEGKLGPEVCGQAGAYLEKLIREWEKELEEGFDDDLDYDIKQGKELADLMLRCYANDATLLFF